MVDQKAEEQRMTGAPSMPSGAEGDALMEALKQSIEQTAPSREPHTQKVPTETKTPW
jgi:non-homologous end joining protein Ku